MAEREHAPHQWERSQERDVELACGAEERYLQEEESPLKARVDVGTLSHGLVEHLVLGVTRRQFASQGRWLVRERGNIDNPEPLGEHLGPSILRIAGQCAATGSV
jgi:hypothetical protein